ncbi:MAG: glutaminase domain-containing protein [Planctomycetota bacterium]
MQLMCDCVAVLGSRHGILFDPTARECRLLRFDRFTRMPRFGLRAGVVIDGEEFVFPLASLAEGGSDFDFVDQRSTPTTVRFIGVHAASCCRVELIATTPFRPRDADFSTVPVLGLSLRVGRIPGIFRWKRRSIDLAQVQAFIELVPPADWQVEQAGSDAIDCRFASVRAAVKQDFSDVWDTDDEAVAQHDRLVALDGTAAGRRLSQTIHFTAGRDDEEAGRLDVAWCTWSQPVFELHGTRRPFLYAARFAGLDAVCDWARAYYPELTRNAAAVDRICTDHDRGVAVDRMLAYTLHSWLANTWWVPGWFSVWEGSCYFHSTVDVEFTQSPFYLALWPELLELELDNWPDFSNPGEELLGETGANTSYLSHDTGAHAEASRQYYSHDMAVEETANYLILACATWARTGRDHLLRKHAATLRAYLRFLVAADSNGNGVPDRGVANTIDDASPAVQFGREQVYLAAKTLAAFVAGERIFAHLGDAGIVGLCRARSGMLREAIDTRGWLGDHYAVLLERGGTLVNPWSGQQMECAEIPGWDAAHIYTVNGLVPLDMAGIDVGLDHAHLATDLRTATRRCCGTYGCAHSDYANENMAFHDSMLGLAGVAAAPGWTAMNLLRDVGAGYRGLDLTRMCERYWDWQATTNTQEAKLFFETFGGNNLCFYPRGVAAWGLFDALGGVALDRPGGVERSGATVPGPLRVPRLYDADWVAGTCCHIEA